MILDLYIITSFKILSIWNSVHFLIQKINSKLWNGHLHCKTNQKDRVWNEISTYPLWPINILIVLLIGSYSEQVRSALADAVTFIRLNLFGNIIYEVKRRITNRWVEPLPNRLLLFMNILYSFVKLKTAINEGPKAWWPHVTKQFFMRWVLPKW